MNDNAYIEGLANILRHNLCGQPSVEAIINDVKDWHREQGLRVVPYDPRSAMGAAGWQILDREDLPLHKLPLPNNLPHQIYQAMLDAAKGGGDERS